jgi:3-oxoacyl-[acyl-carrier protein] reductase
MNIIVTGASRGIGYEMVKLFSRESSHTIFAIARNADKLESLKKECREINDSSRVVPIACDLGNDTELNNLYIQITKSTGVIDLLINNAGAIVNKPFLQITPEDLNSVYNVNVFAVFKLIQKIQPLMNQEKRSHVVNISSMGGFQGSSKFAGLSAYSSGKAAVACLTECLAEEFKEKNTAFNCLALGAAQTEMLEEAFPGYKAPLSAKEMAEFIVDFAGKAHHYLNGKIIPVSTSTP